MLGKLLKYDFKWVYKVVLIFNILSIIFAIISRISSLIPDSYLFNFISGFTGGLAIGFIICAIINLIIRSWVRFINNVYKDESYLTHTLPVSKNAIYFSKILSAILCLLITTIVAIICLFICFYSKENITFLKELFTMITNTYNVSVIMFLLIISLVLFLEIILIVIIGYVAIIFGYSKNNYRTIYSLVYGFLMYFAMQVVSLILVFVFGLVNIDVMNIIKTTNTINMPTVKTIFILAIIMYLIYNILFVILGSKKFQKGVNVE